MSGQSKPKTTNKKKFTIITLITLSYVFTYFAPIVMMYFALRKSFVTKYITKNKYSLSFLGFVTVSSVLIIVLLIRLTIKLAKSEASVFKTLMSSAMSVFVLLFLAFLILKTRDVTYLIEDNSIVFFDSLRHFLTIFKNYVLVFAGLLTLSALSRLAAILIDKEYVRSLNWL